MKNQFFEWKGDGSPLPFIRSKDREMAGFQTAWSGFGGQSLDQCHNEVHQSYSLLAYEKKKPYQAKFDSWIYSYLIFLSCKAKARHLENATPPDFLHVDSISKFVRCMGIPSYESFTVLLVIHEEHQHTFLVSLPWSRIPQKMSFKVLKIIFLTAYLTSEILCHRSNSNWDERRKKNENWQNSKGSVLPWVQGL